MKKYLDDNFQQQLTLDDLSSKFYVSKYYMSREFKRVFGMNVLSYLMQKRIDYAKVLLAETTLSAEQIAKRCGFSGINYFARQFKKSEGMTSLEYRKKAAPKKEEE